MLPSVVDESPMGAAASDIDFLFITKVDRGQEGQIHHMGDISHIKTKDIIFNCEKVIFARLVMTGNKER
jgi:hypothetical protein